MGTLRLLDANFHEVRVAQRRLLFHVASTSLFELDPVGAKLLDVLREYRELSEEQLFGQFEGSAGREEVGEALADFCELGVVGGGNFPAQIARQSRPIREFPLSTLVLNVTTGCNLSCTYCYKEDLATPVGGKRMDFETACRSVDLLLKEGSSRPRLNIVFFGGEPLTNLPLIRQVVDYAERRGTGCGKRIDFSLTTNAVLLNEALVEYFDSHRFGLTVSIDGPKSVHDRNRRTVGGTGTYDLVAKNVRMLLGRYRSRPVGARVTLAAGAFDAEAIFDHLRYDLGFAEVGLAPVTAGGGDGYELGGTELAAMFGGMKRLGARYERAAIAGEYLGFTNLHRLIADLHEGAQKALPCGAGVALLAVDWQGRLNLCHRFTGSEMPTFGDVERGIDKPRLGALLDGARELAGRDCETCHIRTLCSGGCYHERYRRYGDPLHPAYHYCDLMRDWVDFAIGVYASVAARNPGFLERHVGHSERYAEIREVLP